MTNYDPSLTGNYYILGDSQAEGVHLIEQDRNFTRSLGGLLPEQSQKTIARIQTALDIACGPGGWVLGMAQAHQHIHVTGLDISKNMIDYATVQAHASGLDNASFKVGNIIEPLDFPDASFDLVNARHIEEVIPVAVFAPLFKEIVRITKPGGIIRITGSEWGVTNSNAYERFLRLTLQAARMARLDFSVDERNVSIAPWLRQFLLDAGCVNIQERPSILDFSTGSELHRGVYQDFTLGFELMQPFLTALGIITQQEVARLQEQLLVEMLQEDFCGLVYTITAWGQKPENAVSQAAPSINVNPNIELSPVVEGDGTVPRLFHFDLAALDTSPGLTDAVVSSPQRVLDVASGDGEWALRLGQTAPGVEIVGIEGDARLVDRAREQARERGLANVSFTATDPFQRLDFSDNSFDLINVRYIVGLIPAEAWPGMLRELHRVTRPGGTIRVTEAELPITNSPALAQLGGLISQAFFQTQRSFSPEGRLFSVTPALKRLVQDAGYQPAQQVVTETNFSSGMTAYAEVIQDLARTYRLVLPFLVNNGVATQQEVEQLYQQMLSEVQRDDFLAVAFSLTVLSKK